MSRIYLEFSEPLKNPNRLGRCLRDEKLLKYALQNYDLQNRVAAKVAECQINRDPDKYAAYLLAEFFNCAVEKSGGKETYFSAKLPKQEFWEKIDPRLKKYFSEFVSKNIQNFAASKNPHFRHLASEFYRHGIGVEKDLNRAFAHCTFACEKGYKPAVRGMIELGWECAELRRESLAKDCYEKAAQQENPVALRYLAYCYRDGFGVRKDHALALKYFIEAIENGSETARSDLENFAPEERFISSPLSKDHLLKAIEFTNGDKFSKGRFIGSFIRANNNLGIAELHELKQAYTTKLLATSGCMPFFSNPNSLIKKSPTSQIFHEVLSEKLANFFLKEGLNCREFDAALKFKFFVEPNGPQIICKFESLVGRNPTLPENTLTKIKDLAECCSSNGANRLGDVTLSFYPEHFEKITSIELVHQRMSVIRPSATRLLTTEKQRT